MRKASARWSEWLVAACFALAVWTVAGPAAAGPLPVDRVIDLEGTTNTRDIGGYATAERREVRMGQILRSENLSRLTADDFQRLEEIGVRTVIDLRSAREHEEKPTVWQGDNPPQFFHFPIGDADNAWFRSQSRMMKDNRFTEEQALEHMVDGYRMIAEEGPSSYRELMALVLDASNWPILIHCNAGKDRTGIATALILEAVGVERDVIMDDYLLTNDVGRSGDKAALLARESAKYARHRRSPSAEAWYPIVGVRAEMLQAFYASVDERHGSMDAFLASLGADSAVRATLVERLTEERPSLAMGE